MIGLLGGTFDPIHFGHLRPALELLQLLELEELHLVPLAVAVHRGAPAASPALRLAMAEAAVAGQPGLRVDGREVRRAGPSYTVDTLRELRREAPGPSLCLCIGADAFNDFLAWRRPLDILDLAHLVVMQRPDTPPPATPALVRLLAERQVADVQALRRQPAGGILFQPVTQLQISATAIRALVAAGRSPRYLLPESVLAIIQREGLYRGA
jgi:nicotinate-nucleotide adenylyltransferase